MTICVTSQSSQRWQSDWLDVSNDNTRLSRQLRQGNSAGVAREERQPLTMGKDRPDRIVGIKVLVAA